MPRVSGWTDFEHRLSVGLDYKAFSNSGLGFINNGVLQPAQPDITVHPLSLTYSGSRRLDNAQFGFYGTLLRNIYPHGNDAGAEKFNGPNGSRPGIGEPKYTVWRAGFNYTYAFANDVQLRAVTAGQYTRDALIPGEQFGLGGWDNLRGMQEREASNDRGLRASVEIYSPDLSAAMSIPKGRLRLLAFYDWGYLSQNFKDHPQTVCAPAACRFSASSVGFGMRLTLEQGFSMRLDYAQMYDPAIIGERGDSRLHFGMGLAF